MFLKATKLSSSSSFSLTLIIHIDVARPDKISGADINAIVQEVSLTFSCASVQLEKV